MADDPHKPRFFAYLSLFTFAMLTLVTAADFMQLFFGWEGVGLASYLLIGFWYQKPTANAAAIKAFVVNRVGDFGFALGIMTVFWVFGTIQFAELFPLIAAKAGHDLGVRSARPGRRSTWPACLLFIGAMGKSAQFFLHTWLPDAMEGPTPVSALIHAATMVTAGVYMVCLLSPLFEYAPVAKHDRHHHRRGHRAVRRHGRPGPERHQAGHRLFDLLAARLHVLRRGRRRLPGGDVPPVHPRLLQGAAVPRRRLGDPRHAPRAGHAEHGRAARSYLPITYAVMTIGTIAITGLGIPGVELGFAGFYSKDAIIEAAFAAGAGERHRHTSPSSSACWSPA